MIQDGWNGFNVLHAAAARVGGLELGFVPGPGGRDVAGILEGAQSAAVKLVWLLGADELEMDRLGEAFVVYQGHHGDRGAHRADVILPGAAYTEKNGTYVNTEGRVQRGRLAVFPPGNAREDWKILRAFSAKVGDPLPYDTLDALRRHMAKMAPVFATIDAPVAAGWEAFGKAGKMTAAAFESSVDNFYMTDPICRASETMARCVAEILQAGVPERTGTDG